MAIKVGAQLAVSSGGLPPLTVDSSVLCAGLNADLLDGLNASAFALVSHEHAAADVTSGTFPAARTGSNPINGRWLYTDGLNSAWTTLTIGLINGVSSLGAELVGATTEAGARNVIQAAPAVHTHTAVDVTAGVFDVDRLGSGGGTSGGKVLFGTNVDGSSGQWKQIVSTDVLFGATVLPDLPVNYLPYWVAPGVLGNSALQFSGTDTITDGAFIAQGTIVSYADIGAAGTVTCNDLNVNYAAATYFKSAVYNKVKATVVGSGSVTVTPNDGLQTLTLTSSGGSTPPTTPANAVYVWVVNATADGGDWLQLLGAE